MSYKNFKEFGIPGSFLF